MKEGRGGKEGVAGREGDIEVFSFSPETKPSLLTDIHKIVTYCKHFIISAYSISGAALP